MFHYTVIEDDLELKLSEALDALRATRNNTIRAGDLRCRDSTNVYAAEYPDTRAGDMTSTLDALVSRTVERTETAPARRVGDPDALMVTAERAQWWPTLSAV